MSKRIELDGLWDFAFLGKVAESEVSVEDVKFSEKTPVPGAFDALPTHAGKLGMAVYRRSVKVPPGRRARLEFGAVSRWGRVYVDGQALAETANAYAPVEVELPAVDFEKREIRVLVDNRFNFERSPLNLDFFDWYQYGGIIRRVGLRIYPEEGVWIDTVQVTPDAQGYREGKVSVRVVLGGKIESVAAIGLEFDEEGKETSHALGSGDTLIAVAVPNPSLWSPDAPNLHSVRVTLRDKDGREIDGWAARFGLRRLEARDGKFWLNGEAIKFRGYNRHEWHPNFGPSTPVLQQSADLQILKDAGCNLIRAHYSCDTPFMDLCDELGFLLWEEINAGLPKPNYATEKFFLDHDAALRATVRASFNHPSVVVRGFFNECASDEEFSYPIYEQIARSYRELDPSRLVSYASNKALKDRNLDLVDFIALNLYPGWYRGWGDHGQEDLDPLEMVLPCLRKCLEFYSAPEWKDKPLIVSEIGAEALYGWHDRHHDYFTEEYQAELLERACREMLNHPRSSGIIVWQFSDTRTWRGSRSMTRPRTFNNKGTYDEYRRPKLAAGVVREIFHAAAGKKG